MDRIRVFIRKQYTLPLLALLIFSATVAVGGEAYRARRVVAVENFKKNIPEPDVRESGLIREFLASSVAGMLESFLMWEGNFDSLSNQELVERFTDIVTKAISGGQSPQC